MNGNDGGGGDSVGCVIGGVVVMVMDGNGINGAVEVLTTMMDVLMMVIH